MMLQSVQEQHAEMGGKEVKKHLPPASFQNQILRQELR